MVLEEAVQSGYGVWQEGRSVCLLSATAVSEWAERIHGWALEHGLEQSVATLYEVHASAAAAKQSQRTTERSTAPLLAHPHTSAALPTATDWPLRVCLPSAAFYGLPGDFVYAALQRLAAQGRCTLLPGGVLSETGIKFKGA